MIIRINKDGKEIANCEIMINEYGTMMVLQKEGIKAMFHEQKEEKSEMTDILEIDLEN